MAAFPRPTAFAVSFLVLLSACRGGGDSTSSAVPSPPISAPISTTSSPATDAPDAGARAPGDARYGVSLRGTADGVVWRGTQEISFTNTGGSPMRRIWLRAWANGVQGCEPLAVELTAVEGGGLGSPRQDCTALPVTLPDPLDPGERTTIGFDLSITVPARNDRFGHHLGIALLGNSLPTLAVHDDQGWHLDPYVDLGESFYSVVSRYRVDLDVPVGLETPSTGSLVSTATEGEREIRTYVARDVRDFVWAAGDLDVVRDTVDGVRVSVWFASSFMTASRARLILRDSVRAMTAYGDAFGPYPYPAIDVVTAAFTSFQGMEYPRIVFANPERRVLAHELAHQWWYAVVGNDQYAEPWLDESFATWASTLPWFPWTRCSSYDWPSDRARLTNDMGYWGDHPGEYATVYEGGACMLADLADRFGLRPFTALLAGYAGDHWLGVATTDDFQRRIERAAARHLTGFDPAAYWEIWRVD